MKPIKFNKPKVNISWKTKAIVIVGIFFIAFVMGYQGLKWANNWRDHNRFVFGPLVTFHKPIWIEEVEPQVVEKITKEIVYTEKENYVFVRVSHYYPPLGGTNCGHFVDGECTSTMANGERWQEWVGLAIACPPEWEFGTKLKIGERIWTCKDRGSAIQTDGDLYWVDMLSYEGLYDYGEIVKAEIVE